MSYHREINEIVKIKQVLGYYSEEFWPGQYSYPFMLYLPDWLPDSLN
jgi:hypothetical protein